MPLYHKDHSMLTITEYGNGKCTWCLAHGEGVQAIFQDGLTGFLCRKHFWEALKARSEKQDHRSTSSAPEKRPSGERA